MDGGVEFHFTGSAEGARDSSYPLTIGLEGATKELTELRKGSAVGVREVCFFRCYLRRSSLKDTVSS